MTLEVVALVDDNEKDLQVWQEYLAKAGIEARPFNNKEAFTKSLIRGDHFDAVVLDWYLEEVDSSLLAQLVLEQFIRPNRFIPVLVYTGENDIARDEIQRLRPPFNKIEVISKDETDASQLAGVLKEWYGTTSARIAEVWRKARQLAFEQALYELDALEGEELQVTLQHLIVSAEDIQIDVDHALDFLERLVARKVPTNPELRKTLMEILNEVKKFDAKKAREIGRSKPLINAHRYIPVNADDKFIRTGDIVDVHDPEEDKHLLTAVVITPACDLDKRKCRELRLLIAEKAPPQENTEGEQWWELPAVFNHMSSSFDDYWLNFHRALCLSDSNIKHAPVKNPNTKPSRFESTLSYSATFTDSFGRNVQLKPICRLDDPYRSDLLQKFSSHAARIGIP